MVNTDGKGRQVATCHHRPGLRNEGAVALMTVSIFSSSLLLRRLYRLGCIYMHVLLCMNYRCTGLHVYMHIHYEHMYADLHADINACIGRHTYIVLHVETHACIHTYIQACMHERMLECLHACTSEFICCSPSTIVCL